MSSASLYYTPSTTTTTTTAAKPRTASTKRRVRFTFGYSSRTPSFGSLPPSPTADHITQGEPSSSTSTVSSPSSTLLTSTSLPIMHMPTPIDTISTYNRPTADDLTAMMIPTRTSSITSTTSTSSTLTPSSSSPTSRCSSITSGFSYNGSLDHRTMRSTTSSSYSAHRSTSSISSSITMPAPATPASPAAERLPSPASPVAPPPPPPSGRRPSVVERSAFLASAPVRSRAQIYPRLKNMCPAPSTTLGTATTTFFTNTSLPSLTTRCFSNFHTNAASCCLMNPCGVSLEKRRWSNDSTRGLYGGVESTSSSSGTFSFLSNDDGRTSTSSTVSSSGESTFVEENDGGADTKTKGGRMDKKKPKKAKKSCPSLALFSFMLKK